MKTLDGDIPLSLCGACGWFDEPYGTLWRCVGRLAAIRKEAAGAAAVARRGKGPWRAQAASTKSRIETASRKERERVRNATADLVHPPPLGGGSTSTQPANLKTQFLDRKLFPTFTSSPSPCVWIYKKISGELKGRVRTAGSYFSQPSWSSLSFS